MKIEELSKRLMQNYNLILRGAPGTGKTYLARAIAAEVIGVSVAELGMSEQFEFVQFHPNYDYTDFVEGLRPVQVNGQIGFEPKDGIFKQFCKRAKYDDSFRYFNRIWSKFILNVAETGRIMIPSASDNQNQEYVIEIDDSLKNKKTLEIVKSEQVFSAWNESYSKSEHYKAIIRLLKDDYNLSDYNNYLIETESMTSKKKYVFIIDEINRGEISKIFGELFFSIDPDYRGVVGSVSTQYSNLFDDEKFYIPQNVYIIGTMNDIDRSIDTFDFAMRRRFTFEEITAEDSQVMLSNPEVIQIMNNVNAAIISDEIGLASDYQIGGSYFKMLDDGKIDKDQLWKNKISPLLKDYFRGERQAVKKLEIMKWAYMEQGDDFSER